jgi:glycerate kinase
MTERKAVVRIILAPDKFKGSLGGREVAENMAAGLRVEQPEAEIELFPMADGGEGTAEVLCQALNGTWMTCPAHDPLGRPIEVRYVWVESRKLAVIEMSEAAGLRHLKPEERDPLRVSTFGVGEMMVDAAQRGGGEMIVGLGGSATNDGGFGMARALGYRFLDARQNEIRQLSELSHLERIDMEALGAGAARFVSAGGQAPVQVTAAADVRNPLLGWKGATRIFGKQKGATLDAVKTLEAALEKLADIVTLDLGCDFRDVPGAGAAGGLGFGLMSFCNATMRSGFDVVAEAVGLEARIRQADFVVTGEGSLDQQTLEGKTPAGVAHLARALCKPVFAIVGRASEDPRLQAMFEKILILGEGNLSPEMAISQSAPLVREAAARLGRELARA